MTLLPLNLRFGFEDALQQDGIFRHHTPLLQLQDLDQRSLLGEFVFQAESFSGMILRSLARRNSSIIER
ncbi:hypothetical protein SM0020_29140 [Sinorhizobium meliloti CCNWSX0020]|uniref:Uncharacterized protein n=1 Tax=Sinorhizobium meliloti CCNWSX0020 TaxID=1107881 RepID=H0G8I9_RHIML|nr:hypothetical protein [Sinorhizobium meliloti]EHK74391.1 hypothetical protein SM0020_29140 [Sinorhizobium meliloti CCNWSX0020]